MCAGQNNWDDPLQGELLKQWQIILSELSSTNQIKISRCYFLVNSRPCDVQLHGFCNASSQAYAAVLYIRSTYPNGHIDVRIVASKSRVAPVRKPTIPLGAVLLARLFNTVTNSLSFEYKSTYWVDSTTVLYWIRNEGLWKQYVNNRLQEIHRFTCKEYWRHCPGQLNPADLPTQGLKGEELTAKDLWWSGPQFLKTSESNWPSNLIYNTDNSALSELRKEQTEHPILCSHQQSPKREN